MIDRWIPLGVPSITESEGEYEGHTIRFRQGKYGDVRATCFDDDGRVVDSLIGADFMDAYSQAMNEWPGATWHNREEDE
jgi:hypothetical protein